MKIAVFGLWHLGTVTAACLAQAGFDVVGVDYDDKVVNSLRDGKPPVWEPGLDELLRAGKEVGRLQFSSSLKSAQDADIVWVTFDTPVDESDHADVDFVKSNACLALHSMKQHAILLISSQVPVGFTEAISAYCEEHLAEKHITVAYSPENLRLGRAIDVFSAPERVIIGCSSEIAKDKLTKLFAPFTSNILWMSVSSAEMVKHALNAFLAVSVSYINEIANICEAVGADAHDVARGLKSDTRIGPKAYLSPGGPIAGGTLARDVNFLEALAVSKKLKAPLIQSVLPSNREHKRWAGVRLTQALGSLAGQPVTVLGLTYKPGTNTLRRSSSVELCQWLAEQGSRVVAHDPAVTQIPEPLSRQITLAASIAEALKGTRAVVVATEWPEYRNISARELQQAMEKPIVLDPNGFLRANLGGNQSIRYMTVGMP